MTSIAATPPRRILKGMSSLTLDSPLTESSANIRARAGPSPARRKGAARTLFRAERENAGVDDFDARGVVSKDWDGPDIALPRRRSSAMSAQRGDRYIPNRDLVKSGSGTTLLEDGAGDALGGAERGMPALGDADGALEDACHVDLGQRILSFSAAPPAAAGTRDLRSRYAAKTKSALPSSLLAAGRRRIATTPERVLDAPAIVPDFYYNLLHWSSSNVIAIALQGAVHTWNSETGEAAFLLDLEEESERVGGGGLVSSLRWDADGNILAVGTDRGFTQLWDVERGVRLRTLRPSPLGGADAATANALAWAPDGTLNVGYASGLIREHDVRQRDSTTRSLEKAHAAQVCGMAWRDDSALLASGGNDNVVKVWDRRTSVAKMRKENHRAAVKALAWSPHNSSLLATGGGSADRCIHFWNTTQNTRVQTIQTPAQVTALQWAPHYRELVSAHGVGNECSHGALNVWAHPSCTRVGEIAAAHDGRILHTSLSPDGETLATVGCDESLKFWRVFEQSAELKGKSAFRRAAPGAGGAAAAAAAGAAATGGAAAAAAAAAAPAPRSLR